MGLTMHITRYCISTDTHFPVSRCLTPSCLPVTRYYIDIQKQKEWNALSFRKIHIPIEDFPLHAELLLLARHTRLPVAMNLTYCDSGTKIDSILWFSSFFQGNKVNVLRFCRIRWWDFYLFRSHKLLFLRERIFSPPF